MENILCNCLTKTPEPKFHMRNCPVWLADRVKRLEGALKSVLDLSPLWMPPKDKVSCEFGDEYKALSGIKARLEYLLALKDGRPACNITFHTFIKKEKQIAECPFCKENL